MKVRTVGNVSRVDKRKSALQRAGLRRKLRRRADPEYDRRLREYEREYRKRNAERIRELRKAWVEANRDLRNAYHRRRYELDPARREYLARKTREYRARKAA